MFRRNSTHRRPLRRSKSTSSIIRGPSDCLANLHAHRTDRDAHIAANLSYHRSYDQAWAHRGIECGCRGSQGLLRRSNTINGPSKVSSLEIPDRRQSVRFTGPDARPRRQIAARARPISLNSSLPYTPRASNQHGFSHHHSTASSYDQPFPIALTSRSSNCSSTLSEDYYHSGPILPIPIATYRRGIRKSKSMCGQLTSSAPKHNSGQIQKHHSNLYLGASGERDQNETIPYSIRRSLRTPKSMSYIDYQHESAINSKVVTKVRDGYVSNKENHQKGSFRRLRSHSSVFFRSMQRRHDSSAGASGSLRNSSDNSTAMSSAISVNEKTIMRASGIRFNTRRVSKNVMKKLTRLFSRSRSIDTTGTDAGDCGTDGDSDRQLTNTPVIEEASMSRVTSHVPSLHAVQSFQQIEPRQGSFDSVSLDGILTSDDRSRVTSWDNSTANSVMSYSAADNRSYPRLSVIKENGMHISSSSRNDAPQEWGTPDMNTTPSAVTVDSQRIYSALIQKLINTPVMEERDRDNSRGNQIPHESVPSRQGSLHPAESNPWSPPTIRCIGTDDDDVFEDSNEEPSHRIGIGEKGVGQHSGISHDEVSYNAYPNPSRAGKGTLPTPTTTTPSASKSAPLESAEVSSNAASPSNYLFRTTSPYRRTLQRSMKDGQESEHTHALDTRYLSTLSALSLPTRRPSTIGSERDLRLTYAESFYSFITEDHATSPPLPSPPRAQLTPFAETLACAAMHADNCPRMATPIHGRDISAASSVEWKTWLSAHVSKLETPHTPTGSQDLEGFTKAMPSLGHVRESAEIESPAEMPKVGAMGTPTHTEWKENVKVTDSFCAEYCQLSSRTSDAAHQSSPEVRENSGLKLDGSQKDPSHLTPPIPGRSALRAVASLPNVINDAPIKMVQPPASVPGKHSQAGQLWSPCDQENSKRGALTSSKSTPGFSTAARLQLAKSRSNSSTRQTADDAAPSPQRQERSDLFTNVFSEPNKSEWEAQVKGSRRMVDLFLNSRRKAIQGTISRNGSENFSTAFL